MIARMVEWIRARIKGDPYDPESDPVWRSLNEAKVEGQKRAAETHNERRVNRLEAAYLHRKIQPRNGQEGPHV